MCVPECSVITSSAEALVRASPEARLVAAVQRQHQPGLVRREHRRAGVAGLLEVVGAGASQGVGERGHRRQTTVTFMTSDSPIGERGRVTSTGAIRPGRTGEVMVAVGGGVQAYLARDADGGAIDAYEEIVVVDQVAPRTVLVTRLYERSPTESHQETSP